MAARAVDHPFMVPHDPLPQLAFAMPGQGGYTPYAPPPGPYGPPGGGMGYPVPPPMQVRQMHTLAIVSLIAGIISWFGCPFIGGIVALITGAMARKAIKAEPQRWDGDGMALGGMIVGAINLGLWTLVGLFYLLIFVGAISAAILGS